MIGLPVLFIGLLIFGLFQQGFVSDWTKGFRQATATVMVVNTKAEAVDNAQLTVGGVTGATDAEGRATLADLTSGNKTLTVTKTGFTAFTQELQLKRGSNDLGTITLTELPIQKVSVTLKISHYIADTNITDATVELGDILPIRSEENYKFNDVPVGSHQLSVAKAGFVSFTSTVTVDEKTAALDPVTLVPEGKIVFESNRDRGKRGIFTANYDGSNQKNLVTRNGDLEDYTPILSPTQKKVFFTSTRDGLKRENDPNTYKQFLYVVDIDGKNLAKISETDGSYAVWSPDGGYIGFTKYTSDYSKSEVYTFDVARRTTYEFSDYNSSSFAFSPDGKLIAFGGKKVGQNDYRLYYANSNATNVKEAALGDATQNFYSMEFTANGKLRYSRFEANRTRWYEYDLATNISAEVTAPAIDRESAVFSPDKKLRAYVSTRDGKANLYVSDPDGKNEKKLTDLNRVVGTILWSRDGSFLMFDYRSDDESARYVVATSGLAKPKKIVDINLTYYY